MREDDEAVELVGDAAEQDEEVAERAEDEEYRYDEVPEKESCE